MDVASPQEFENSLESVKVDAGPAVASLLWKSLGKTYRAMGDFESERQMYERAIAIYAAAIEGINRFANNLLWEYTTSGFGEVINQHSLSEGLLWVLLGEVLKESGDYERAIQALERARSHNPGSWLEKEIELIYMKQNSILKS